MHKFLNRIKLVFSYAGELDTIVQTLRKDEQTRMHNERRHNLNLCKAHQPSNPGSHYSAENCHHCQLIIKLHEHE